MMDWVIRIGILSCALYGLALLGIVAFERRLIYPASFLAAMAAPSAPEATATPLTIPTPDGETLQARYVAAEPGAPLALYFHGNGDTLTIGFANDAIDALHDFGLAVLAIDYRGFGASTGSPSEAGLHIDAETAFAKALDLGYTPDRIVIVGQSLGSGVAVLLASRHRVAGVLLDCPFSALVDVAAWLLPIFPVHRLMHDQFRSDQVIAGIGTPLMIVHGENDWTVPLRLGRRLFDLASEPKRFLAVPGQGHLVLGEPESEEPIRQWLSDIGLVPRPAAVQPPAYSNS